MSILRRFWNWLKSTDPWFTKHGGKISVTGLLVMPVLGLIAIGRLLLSPDPTSRAMGQQLALFLTLPLIFLSAHFLALLVNLFQGPESTLAGLKATKNLLRATVWVLGLALGLGLGQLTTSRGSTLVNDGRKGDRFRRLEREPLVWCV